MQWILIRTRMILWHKKDQAMDELQSGLGAEKAFRVARAAPGFPVLETPRLPAMLDAPTVPGTTRRLWLRNSIFVALAVAALAGAAYFAWEYWASAVHSL
jgi:hypothetical protein